MHAQFRTHADSDFLGDGLDALPSRFRIERMRLALHEGDIAVSKIVEVTQREGSGVVVVEHDVGDTTHLPVAGDGDDGNLERLSQQGVDQDKAVDGALGEESRIAVDQVGTTLMADNEVQVAGFEKVFLDTVHDHSEVAFAELGDDYPNGKALARAQGTSEEVCLVVELFCGGEYAVAGLRRDALCTGSVVDHEGHGRGRDAEISGERLQAYRTVVILASRSALHGCHRVTIVVPLFVGAG